MFMPSISGILFSLIYLLIIFFVIKGAVQVGIRDAYRERNSGTDFDFKQTKLLAEIARANGVSEAQIQEILKED